MLKVSLITIASLAVHPGHGTGDGFSLLHYLTEPIHLLGGVAVLQCVVLTVAFVRRRARAATAAPSRDSC